MKLTKELVKLFHMHAGQHAKLFFKVASKDSTIYK